MLRTILTATLLVAGCGSRTTKTPAVPQTLAPLSGQAYAHYLRGQVAMFEGETDVAISELRLAAQHAPNEAPIALALIQALHVGGRSPEATRHIQRAQIRWPKNAQVWAYTGALHRSLHQYQRAARGFKRAITLGRSSEEDLLGYADMLVRQKQWKTARRIYDKTLNRHNASTEAHYQLAKIAFSLREELGPAITHLETTTDLNPYELKAWALLAACFYQRGQPELGNDALRAPFDRSEGQFWVAAQLFSQLLDLDVPEIAARLDVILDRNDLPIDTRISMAHWHLHVGDFEGALRRAKVLASYGTTEAMGPLAELRALALRALKRDDEARSELEKISDDSQSWPLAQVMLAELALDQNQPERARILVTTAIQIFPDDASLTLTSALIEERADNLASARAILLKAIDTHPRSPRPRYALAQLESRHGKISAAIDAISPLLKANPSDENALNYIGYALIKVPKAQQRARSLLQRALELSPDSPFILDSYGWFLFQSGDSESAAPFLERAARLTPTEAEVTWHLAELRWQQGKKTESRTLFRRAQRFATPRLRQKIRARRHRLVD